MEGVEIRVRDRDRVGVKSTAYTFWDLVAARPDRRDAAGLGLGLGLAFV